MRIALIAAVFATAVTPMAAEAQTTSARRSGQWVAPQGRSIVTPPAGRQWRGQTGGRWGGQINGRWYGGVHAPGGWAAYRRPFRGWVMPPYWTAPSFVITDWQSYGLSAPPQGYGWYRYYDDAVLADPRGQVFDSVNSVDWDRDEEIDGRGYSEPPIAPEHPGATYPPPYEERRDTGAGGAVIGGVIGGVAGNVIAGRGNRLAGTLLGAGAGAIAGAAIDRGEDRGRRRRYAPGLRYDDRYGGGDAHGGYSVYGGYDAPPPAVINTPGGATVVTQSSGGGWGGSTTTVIVQPAVTTTTTTTEYVYESVAAAPRRVVRKRSWRPRAKAPACPCVCRVVCR